MADDKPEVWRWNVNDVWQTYSSMFQESCLAKESREEYFRYHHLSAALLFGGCAIESFLNTQYREYYKDTKAEEEIFRKLRYTTLADKLKKWPIIIFSIDIKDGLISTITDFLELRNDVTHRKRRDHSLYQELDKANIDFFIEAIQKAFLSCYIGKEEPFPYWLMGWNYVGYNHSKSHPCILNNVQFRYSLRNMGFDVPARDYYRANEWESNHMLSFDGYEFIKKEIYDKAPIIEPDTDAPRLSKKWWDKTLL